MRNYFFVSVILIAGGLISAGLLEIYFRYNEGLEQVGLAQQDAANGAALQNRAVHSRHRNNDESGDQER